MFQCNLKEKEYKHMKDNLVLDKSFEFAIRVVKDSVCSWLLVYLLLGEVSGAWKVRYL